MDYLFLLVFYGSLLLRNSLLPIAFLFLHLSLQYFTSSQFFCHFLRQVKGRLQTIQILVGRCNFLWAITNVVLLLLLQLIIGECCGVAMETNEQKEKPV